MKVVVYSTEILIVGCHAHIPRKSVILIFKFNLRTKIYKILLSLINSGKYTLLTLYLSTSPPYLNEIGQSYSWHLGAQSSCAGWYATALGSVFQTRQVYVTIWRVLLCLVLLKYYLKKKCSTHMYIDSQFIMAIKKRTSVYFGFICLLNQSESINHVNFYSKIKAISFMSLSTVSQSI